MKVLVASLYEVFELFALCILHGQWNLCGRPRFKSGPEPCLANYQTKVLQRYLCKVAVNHHQ